MQAEVNDPGSIAARTVYRFVRKGRLKPKISVLCNDNERFCFQADESDKDKVCIHPGASTDMPAFGHLTFSTSFSSFGIAFAADSEVSKTDVKAKAGYPHPKTFSFSIPSSIGGGDGEWRHRKGWLRNKINMSESLPVIYDLYQGPHNAHVATLTVRKKSIADTTISWTSEPRSELEQAFVVLSGIGVAVRLGKGLQASGREARDFFGLSMGNVFFTAGAFFNST